MEREDIFELVKTLAAEKADIDPGALTVDTRQSDVGLDSIHMVDLMVDVEERLGIRLEMVDLPRNPTLGDVVDLIQANIGPGA